MKNSLVLLKGKKILTTSEIIAKETKIQHSSVMKLITEHENDLKEFGVLRFEIRKPKKGSKGGRPNKITYLSEQQTMLLIMFMDNNKIVTKFKIDITKEFYRMKKQVEYYKNIQSDDEWKELRKESKEIRLKETYEIKRLNEYAVKNGSNNADNYYIHYSNLIWKYLFDMQIDCENPRDILNKKQLHIAMQGEYIIRKCIREGLEQEIDYHDIYKNTRENIKMFSQFIEITKIPYYTQISMI